MSNDPRLERMTDDELRASIRNARVYRRWALAAPRHYTGDAALARDLVRRLVAELRSRSRSPK